MENSISIELTDINNLELANISGGGIWDSLKNFLGINDGGFHGFGGGSGGGGGASGSW